MHIWITCLSAIRNLDTFAEGHRDDPKGLKVNKQIIIKIEKVWLFFIYEEVRGAG